MALQRDTRYPGRWTTGNSAHPQGAFKNRSAPGALDGSYIEQDWANDWDGFFASLLNAASITPNNTVDAVGSSQYFTAMQSMLSQLGHGQCRLAVGSTTTLTLSPYNGRNVIVNGVQLQLPSAGVTYTISGLAASTLYYVYLSGTTAAPVLNLSTTAYVTNTNGVVVKSGDVTQTLVGMVSTNASTQFVDAALSRTCLNWFNRRKIIADSATQPGYTFSNLTGAEINSALRVTFLNWADDVPFISGVGTISMTNQGTTSIATSIDTVGNQYTPSQNITLQTGFSGGFSGHGALGLSEGKHFTMLIGSVNVTTTTVVNVQTIVQVNG